MATRPLKSIAPIALLALVVVLVAAGLWWRQSRTTTLVQQPLPAVAAAQPVAVLGTPPRPGASRQSPGERVVDRKAQRERGMAKRQAAHDAMLRKHRSDPVDPRWAPQMEGKLESVATRIPLAAADAVPTSLQIQCRTTTCTIDAALPTRSQGEDFAMLYMASVGSNIKRAYSTNVVGPDGKSHVMIVAQSR